jgi:hypothetical protein
LAGSLARRGVGMMFLAGMMVGIILTLWIAKDAIR